MDTIGEQGLVAGDHFPYFDEEVLLVMVLCHMGLMRGTSLI
jgi:hypothetical protein